MLEMLACCGWSWCDVLLFGGDAGATGAGGEVGEIGQDMKRKREHRTLTHWRGLTSGLVRTQKNPSEWGAHSLEKARMGLVRWKESSWQGHLLVEGTEDGPACTAT